MSDIAPKVFVFAEEVAVSFGFCTGEEFVYKPIIPADGYALVRVVEVVIIENKAQRQTTNDESR